MEARIGKLMMQGLVATLAMLVVLVAAYGGGGGMRHEREPVASDAELERLAAGESDSLWTNLVLTRS